MPTVEIAESRSAEATHLKAECGVRYWEDAVVDGIEDGDGSRIPCRTGESWTPVIDLSEGRIVGWPAGKTANLHYKVCDDGRYTLLDAAGNPVVSVDGYVPKIMCPGGSGFGDYVIMTIDASGRIENWHPDLSPFQATG